MTIASGIDIVYVPKFKRSIQKGRTAFLQRVFHSSELSNNNIYHLAGLFALKEAVIKALGLPVDSWHEIEVREEKRGAPKVFVLSRTNSIKSQSASISHHGKYVVAEYVVLLK